MEKCYGILLAIMPALAQFPRRPRYQLGARIESAVLDLMELLIQAQVLPATRGQTLRQAGAQVDCVMILLRLAHDLKLLSPRRYEQTVKGLDEVGRQIGGWLRANQARGKGPS